MRLGIALSGGGVRSASQLGIIQALMEKGISPTIYTGSSGGAIVATLLALGNEPEEALKKFKLTNDVLDIAYWEFIKSLFKRSTPSGIYKGKRLEGILDELFEGKYFSNIDSETRLAVVAANINDGKQVIFHNRLSLSIDVSKINDDNFLLAPSLGVSLSHAVSASTRLPAVFMPKPHLDVLYSPSDSSFKCESMLLVDGGIVNNLPSDLAYALGADKVVSIDLGYTGKAREINGLYPIIKQSIEIMQERVVDTNMKSMGIYLNPEIFDVKVLDISRIDECFKRGYDYGVANVDIVIEKLRCGG